jgi:hypothetical protein
MPAHHEEQQTKLHNLQTTKHKKNRKKVKKKNAAPPMFMITNRSIWHFLPVASSAVNDPLGQACLTSSG